MKKSNSKKSFATMPITYLEKRWLKAISLDPRIDIKLVGLDEVEPFFTHDDVLIKCICEGKLSVPSEDGLTQIFILKGELVNDNDNRKIQYRQMLYRFYG